MKYKIGDKVKIKETGEVGFIVETNWHTPNNYCVSHNFNRFAWYQEHDLTPLTKTIRDIEVGDVLVRDGKEYPVLMRNGEVVVYGHKEDYGYSASITHTIDEVIDRGYTIKDAEEEETPEWYKKYKEKFGWSDNYWLDSDQVEFFNSLWNNQ